MRLYTDEELSKAKSKDLLPCKCVQCGKTHKRTKKRILDRSKPHPKFCSKGCQYANLVKLIECKCKQCDKTIYKQPCHYNKVKNHFCSKQCSGIHSNKIKKRSGCRRSKLELWLESNLSKLFPNLNIVYNARDIISLELDIYIPDYNLAFELNGIYHYEPIHGDKKLKKIQSNDLIKAKDCKSKGVTLHIIDTSKQNKVTDKTSKPYLDEILKVLNNHHLK